MVENDLFTNGTADHHGEHHGTTAFGEHHDGGKTHGSEHTHEDGTDSHEETKQERNTVMKSNTPQTLTGLALALMFILGAGSGSGVFGFTLDTGNQSGAFAFITPAFDTRSTGLGSNTNDGGSAIGAPMTQGGGQIPVGGLGTYTVQRGSQVGGGSLIGKCGTGVTGGTDDGSFTRGWGNLTGGGLNGGDGITGGSSNWSDFGEGTTGGDLGEVGFIDGGATGGGLDGEQF